MRIDDLKGFEMQEKAIVVALVCLVGTPTFGQQAKEVEWARSFSLIGPIHIGDENIDSWTPLSGLCISVEFPAGENSIKYKVTYEPYGLEKAYFALEDGRAFELPAQTVLSGKRPNYWGEQVELSFEAPPHNGNFSGRLCADLVDRNDFDDLMLRNLSTWIGVFAEKNSDANTLSSEAKVIEKPFPSAGVGLVRTEEYCVKRNRLRSVSLKPKPLDGGLGVSASYCVGVGELHRSATGGTALTDAERDAFLYSAAAYDDECNFDYGVDPSLARSVGMVTLKTFGDRSINWVTAVVDDCALILQGVAEFQAIHNAGD